MAHQIVYIPKLIGYFSQRSKTIQAIGWIAFANIVVVVIGVVGSLVQAHYVGPDDLGFVRKYSIVANYAAFLSLGLFIILQREYPFLMGRGEPERARRVAAIVQSWYLLVSAVICGSLSIITFIALFQGLWREAAAWFIQIVTVWATFYTGYYLTSTFRSGQEFKRLAQGQFASAVAGVAVLPLFVWFPFPALVLRSVAGQIVSSVYLHLVRPVKVGWCLPWREFADLVQRGVRFYIGNYTRYIFWQTVEIWLMLRIGGDTGVGLFVFSKMIAEAIAQLSIAINQVYYPRLAYTFGQSGSVLVCIKQAIKPTFLNLAISVIAILAAWFLIPPIVLFAFPKYSGSVALMRILVLQVLVMSTSILVQMVTVLDGYLTQLIGAVVGLGVFLVTALILHQFGLRAEAVAWGTLAGQATFAAICLGWVLQGARVERKVMEVVS